MGIKQILMSCAVASAVSSVVQSAVAFSGAVAAAETAKAASPSVRDYFTIGSIESSEIEESETQRAQQAHMALLDAAPGSIGGIVDSLSNPSVWLTLGQKAWEIIKAGKPVLNVESKRISVMPVEEADWAKMENWQGPTSVAYSIRAKNLAGMTVVKLDYRLIYSYGGRLAGKGAYLANVAIVPSAEVLWGFTTNATVEAQRVLNYGSVESPVPGVELQINCSIESPLKKLEMRENVFVRGTGEAMRVPQAN